MIPDSQEMKQPKCSSADEWRKDKEMWFIYPMKHYLVTKR
jgi:hypothetical protein